ncbi:hypothetical protein ABB37_08178 [Leptomonas pyrrhocoris]|uniref:Uncharacterized protein n=1 Tax=Leptomonas pyrrhocoris TaxID=157538 RepID=A0A0N0DSG2_LEPPY|nr:hypothetical protein ABB37_08178 [Leptomonas pyrrhocoris]XP_015654477.1 hypothetical protein ABB37_08178 [Leptomonas pyrrhocoris]KPA76037.1 hypothetical protein ABB37_08178 [Leptomonas pyrrhocoris]KPA76038.1 hypothetical protein ABB37_08178 [Leptomonas pyrrhocoris]|eukprot:XP_015654476.1 hypothetical protein ABB37_08178 [Leptomonas pyrrhocoris]
MDPNSTEVSPAGTGDHHRYDNVKWYHAVNSQQQLVEAAQEITRLFYGEDPPLRSGLTPSPSTSSASGAPEFVRGSSPSTNFTTKFTPLCRVFGIEADVQWHPAVETAVMRHDSVVLPPAEAAAHAAGSPSSSLREGSSGEDFFSLEVFLYTVAQAVQGWKSRAAAAAATAPSGPLRVIVKLDFKAVKAAQLFLTQAEGHTWAGLEALCTSSMSNRSRRRPSLRSFISPRLDSSTSGSVTAAAAAASATPAPSFGDLALPPPAVHVELWWNADVVAQPGATVVSTSFAAAPAWAVQQLMARTAQALGHCLSFSFSLGWVLCPRTVPAEALAVDAASHNNRRSTPSVNISYSEKDDVPTMQAFLDGLALALAGGLVRDAIEEAATRPHPHEQHGGTAHQVARPPPALTPAHLFAACVRCVTFPMLFECVFADSYTEQEKAQAFRGSAVAAAAAAAQRDSLSVMPLASATAAALAAAESRRVASAVTAHALDLFFRPHREGGVNADLRESTPGSGSTAATPDSCCFPTFWKALRPPTSAAGEWQGEVNKAARTYFPYCTIDG